MTNNAIIAAEKRSRLASSPRRRRYPPPESPPPPMVPPRPVAFGVWSKTPSITSTPRTSWATAKPTFTQRDLLVPRTRSIRARPRAARWPHSTDTSLCILCCSGRRFTLYCTVAVLTASCGTLSSTSPFPPTARSPLRSRSSTRATGPPAPELLCSSSAEAAPGHLLGHVEAHRGQHRGRHVSKSAAVAQGCGVGAAEDHRHRAGGVRRQRRVVARVNLHLGVAMVSGDQHPAPRRDRGLLDAVEAAIDELHRAHGGVKHAGVPDHVGVGIVDHDERVGAALDVLHHRVGDLRCTHRWSGVVCGHAR